MCEEEATRLLCGVTTPRDFSHTRRDFFLFHYFQYSPSKTRSGFSQLLRGQLSMPGALPVVPQDLCGMVGIVLCSPSSPASGTACDHKGAAGVGTAGTLCHRQPCSELLGSNHRLGHFFFILHSFSFYTRHGLGG